MWSMCFKWPPCCPFWTFVYTDTTFSQVCKEKKDKTKTLFPFCNLNSLVVFSVAWQCYVLSCGEGLSTRFRFGTKLPPVYDCYGPFFLCRSIPRDRQDFNRPLLIWLRMHNWVALWLPSTLDQKLLLVHSQSLPGDADSCVGASEWWQKIRLLSW